MIPNPRKSIALLVDLSRTSGRSILSGILRFVEKRPEWKIRIMHVHETTPSRIIATLQANQPDGIISSEMEQKPIHDFLETSDIPLAVIGTRKVCISKRRRSVAFVRFEEACIGELAARHLLSMGPFKIFGYVHYTHPIYLYLSTLRAQGFRRTIAEKGFHTDVFGDPNRTRSEDRRALENWLKRLPKPAAVMAGCDTRAVDVIEACTRLKIRIPDELSLISCDDDEFVCESLSPSLSSIRTSIGKVGYQAAAELDRLMTARKPVSKPIRTIIPNELELVERESTTPVPPGLHLARKALRFIHDNATRDIRVKDVVEHLGVSRRLADLRFREFQHESILEAITRIRLREVKRRLLSEGTSISDIARSCGFNNPTYLKKLFKDRYGTNMRDFRQRERTET